MAKVSNDKYESNGDYGGYTGSDFKRERSEDNVHQDEGDEDPEDVTNAAAIRANEYVRELLTEKISLDPSKHSNIIRLLDQEIQKVQLLGKIPLKELKYVDIYRERPMKVSVKVLVPVREHPKFNFVGKLLGPKGNSMKRLQEETMCKMAVLGRGSMKDRQKEEELRSSCDPKYAHLTDDLHVEISALGPPAEAHARVALALAEVRKYLIPDNNDNIRMEQMREMEIMTASPADEPPRTPRRSVLRTSIPRPPVQMRTATRTPVITPRVMPAKTKILSILDRARMAMEESYGFEEAGFEPPEPAYRYSPPPSAHHHYRGGGGGGGGVAPAGGNHHHQYDQDYEPANSYYRDNAYGESSRQRWKSYKSSTATSSRHSDSTRYRSSPYSRPAK